MKKLRILPGAAGIIALTATMGFVDGQREIKIEEFSRGRITLITTPAHMAAEGAISSRLHSIQSDTPAYLVEVRRGDKFAEVLIDGVTGQILLS